MLLLLGLESTDGFDAKRIVGEALAECPLVLLSQHGRGDEDGDLLAIFRGLERSPDGDFRLPEPYVAADEPIH